MLARTIAAIMLLILPLSAQAQDRMVSAADPFGMIGVIQNLGYRATLETDSYGDPIIYSSTNGYEFEIVFFGCTDNVNCQTLMFSADFTGLGGRVSAVDIMNYNYNNRWGRAYLDDALDATLEMDVNMIGGVPLENFQSSFEFWAFAMDEFFVYLPY